MFVGRLNWETTEGKQKHGGEEKKEREEKGRRDEGIRRKITKQKEGEKRSRGLE